MLDPYAILEVGPGATTDEIKRSFRRLAKALHPDINPNNPTNARRFRDIAAAYEMLSDSEKRRQYDQRAAAVKDASDRQSEDGGAFDDRLESFFRARARGSAPRSERADGIWRGVDVHQSLRISFIEAALGTRKRIQIGDQRALDVAVPSATLDGQTLRLKGQGTTGMLGGKPGDVLVEILVEPHPFFTRKEFDIHMTLPITVPEAIQGATATAPTIHGTVQLKIPRGSNTDTLLRLRGKGVPTPDGGAGDQYVTLKVVLPPADDPEFARLIEQWAKRRSYAVR